MKPVSATTPHSSSTPAALPVAIYGAGFIGGRHAEAYLKAGADVVGIASRNVKSAEALAQRLKDTYGVEVPVYPDAPSLFAESGAKAASICVIPSAHGEAERAALENGLSVMVDKPLSHDEETARAIYQAVQETGADFASNYQFTCGAAAKGFEEWLRQPGVEVTGLDMFWRDRRPPPEWWSKQSQSGGPVHEQLTHWINAAQKYFGPVESVKAKGFHIPDAPGRPAEDAVPEMTVGKLRFANGLEGRIFHNCTLGPNDTPEIGLRAFTSSGDELFLGRTEFTVTRGGEVIHRVENAEHPLDTHMRNFVEAVQEGNFSERTAAGDLESYAAAYATHLTTMAVNRSIAKEGDWVAVETPAPASSR